MTAGSASLAWWRKQLLRRFQPAGEIVTLVSDPQAWGGKALLDVTTPSEARRLGLAISVKPRRVARVVPAECLVRGSQLLIGAHWLRQRGEAGSSVDRWRAAASEWEVAATGWFDLFSTRSLLIAYLQGVGTSRTASIDLDRVGIADEFALVSGLLPQHIVPEAVESLWAALRYQHDAKADATITEALRAMLDQSVVTRSLMTTAAGEGGDRRRGIAEALAAQLPGRRRPERRATEPPGKSTLDHGRLEALAFPWLQQSTAEQQPAADTVPGLEAADPCSDGAPPQLVALVREHAVLIRRGDGRSEIGWLATPPAPSDDGGETTVWRLRRKGDQVNVFVVDVGRESWHRLDPAPQVVLATVAAFAGNDLAGLERAMRSWSDVNDVLTSLPPAHVRRWLAARSSSRTYARPTTSRSEDGPQARVNVATTTRLLVTARIAVDNQCRWPSLIDTVDAFVESLPQASLHYDHLLQIWSWRWTEGPLKGTIQATYPNLEGERFRTLTFDAEVQQGGPIDLVSFGPGLLVRATSRLRGLLAVTAPAIHSVLHEGDDAISRAREIALEYTHPFARPLSWSHLAEAQGAIRPTVSRAGTTRRLDVRLVGWHRDPCINAWNRTDDLGTRQVAVLGWAPPSTSVDISYSATITMGDLSVFEVVDRLLDVSREAAGIRATVGEGWTLEALARETVANLTDAEVRCLVDFPEFRPETDSVLDGVTFKGHWHWIRNSLTEILEVRADLPDLVRDLLFADSDGRRVSVLERWRPVLAPELVAVRLALSSTSGGPQII